MSELYKKLTAEFPSEAMTKDMSRGFELTSIKAQYVVERLNEVFGPAGWKADYTVQLLDKEQGCIVKCVLIANSGGGEELIQRSAFGGSEIKKNIGDTIKSAMTDSLSKAASHIGIGNEVFKGKVKVGGMTSPPSVPSAKRTPRL
jgi:hypothetical protein